MKNAALSLLAFVVISLAASAASAQDKALTSKELAIRELVSILINKEDLEKMSSMMMTFQREESDRMIAEMIDTDSQLTAEEKTEVKMAVAEVSGRLFDRVNEFFAKEIDLGKTMTELSIPLDDKHFTEAELREMIAFFRSPVGQKNIKIGPTLMMEATRGFIEKIGPKLSAFVNKAAEEEVARLKLKLQNEKKVKPLPKT